MKDQTKMDKNGIISIKRIKEDGIYRKTYTPDTIISNIEDEKAKTLAFLHWDEELINNYNKSIEDD